MQPDWSTRLNASVRSDDVLTTRDGAGRYERLLALQRQVGNAAFAKLASDRVQLARWGGCGGDTRPRPRPPAVAPPEPRTIWAEQTGGLRLRMCGDPHGGGEPGWDAAVDFGTLDELVTQLQARSHPGSLGRLAISVHGDPGALYLEGPSRPALTEPRLRAALALQPTARFAPAIGVPSPQNLGLPDEEYNARPQYFQHTADNLRAIGRFMAPNAVVRFASCDVARDRTGIALLRLLAAETLHCRVAGFTVAGTARDSDVGGVGCSYPGTRATHGSAFHMATGQTVMEGSSGPNLTHAGEQLAWMDESSSSAVIVSPDGTAHYNQYVLPGGGIGPYDARPGDSDGAQQQAPPPPLETEAERQRAIRATGGFFTPPHRH